METNKRHASAEEREAYATIESLRNWINSPVGKSYFKLLNDQQYVIQKMRKVVFTFRQLSQVTVMDCCMSADGIWYLDTALVVNP